MKNTAGAAISRRFEILAVGCCTLVFLVMFLAANARLTTTLIDDAFITYRYAANWARGIGLVYNTGERVLGTTSPGYALLLGTVAHVLGVDALPTISRVVNVLALLMAACASAATALRVTRNIWIACGLIGLILLGPFTVYASLGGMESPLFVCLLSIALLALVTQRYLASAFVVALLPLIRPEGLFVIGLFVANLAIAALTRPAFGYLSRRRLAELLVVLLAPTVLWSAICYVFYGSIVPESIVAKSAGLYPLSTAVSLQLLVEGLGRSLLISQLPLPGSLRSVLIAELEVIVPALGGVWIARQHRSLWLVPALLFILMGFYGVSKTWIFPHYYAHFEVLLKLCWWSGLYVIAGRLAPKGASIRRLIIAGVAVLVLLPSFILYPWSAVQRGRIQLDDPAFDLSVQRQAEYRRLAQDINPYLPDQTVVLMPEIGELGFYLTHATVLDAAGLVSPQALPYLPVPAELRAGPDMGVVPPGLVRDYQPDVLILLEVFGRKGILDDPTFKSGYTTVVARRGAWLPWGSEALYVFSRNDFAPGMQLQNLVQGP